MIGTEHGPAVGGDRQAIENEDIVAGVLLVDGVALSGCRIPALADDRRVLAWLAVAQMLVTPSKPSQTLTGRMLRCPFGLRAPDRTVG